MKELLDARFAPITHSWGFIEAPLTVVDRAYVGWQEKLFPPGGPARQQLSGSLPDLLSLLDPLTAPPTRILWAATKSDWTAYFDNFVNGSDPFPPVNYLSKELKCRGIRVVCCADTPTGADDHAHRSYGGVCLELYSPQGQPPLYYQRSIYAMNEGGRWAFGASGAPFSFEKTDAYLNRRIKDRFTAELLEEYCQVLGIRLFDSDFYGPSAVIFRRTEAVRTISLADQRKEIGY